MRVLCYGAGAVGSFVAGRLARDRAADVTVLARIPHVAAIRTWGLILEAPGGRAICKTVDAITSLDDLAGPPDLVILTVKSYQTADALADLGDLVRRGIVLVLQNGVGNEEAAIAAAGPDRVIAGALTLSVSLARPGVVRQHTTAGGVALAPTGAVPGMEETAAMFRRAGLPVALRRDYRAMKWSKVLLNLVGNASSAILDLPPAEVARDPRLFRVERDAFNEAVRVMRGLGLRTVALPGYPVPLLARIMAAPPRVARALVAGRIGGGRGEKPPSLWEDLERGRTRSEVEVLNGAVAREGARLGIPTPVNWLLTDLLVSIAAGRRRRDEFRRNPALLLRYLQYPSTQIQPPA
jgi:2-dehydropantoate 2-reductase